MNGRELITNAEMRAIDKASADALVPTRTLMENAGRAVADAIAARFSPRPTAVICGPGNNGGDGWVTARALMERGWPVWVETLKPAAELWGDAFDAANAWKGTTHPSSELNPPAEVYVDAMFGAGLSRPLEGEALRWAHRLAQAPERVVAVDVPSGLDGDSAKPLGEACVRAALTVTFVRKKPAHVLYSGRGLCGDVVVADIGAPEAVIEAQQLKLWENGPELWADLFPWPNAEAHKHARGHVFIASGGHARTGAARMAARAALRVGAGLVTVLSPSDALAENAAQLTAVMLHEAKGPGEYASIARSASCLAIGPAFGLDDAQRANLQAALGAAKRAPMVLDADALTLLSPFKSELDRRDVMTPHVGEFRRLFPDLLREDVNKIETARAASARAGAIVLFKGPDTVIAAPDGRAAVNTSGTPFLATAGAGDVLTGLIAGLIGQGMPSFEAAAAAAWLHGEAAERKGAGLIAEDLPEILPDVLAMLARG
ncbi:MAG TPA: NAD(P)H-hydrate dehydratase [Caulobacterales bacterium]|nr:NAD(P)H-hydrate dehydratase [Caulobacterales bacterium]